MRLLRPTSEVRAGFTLIEIMIVVGIMGVIMTMSVPIVYKMWKKEPMNAALRDVVEVCSVARASAIMRGSMTELVIHPRENRLDAPGRSVQLSDQVIIEMLDINMSGVEYRDAEVAKLKFFPNGTCDEMKMVLRSAKEQIGVETEITTGLANIVRDPLREWARR